MNHSKKYINFHPIEGDECQLLRIHKLKWVTDTPTRTLIVWCGGQCSLFHCVHSGHTIFIWHWQLRENATENMRVFRWIKKASQLSIVCNEEDEWCRKSKWVKLLLRRRMKRMKRSMSILGKANQFLASRAKREQITSERVQDGKQWHSFPSVV